MTDSMPTDRKIIPDARLSELITLHKPAYGDPADGYLWDTYHALRELFVAREYRRAQAIEAAFVKRYSPGEPRERLPPREALERDRRLYGSSWERVDADGSRHRIDPRAVRIGPLPLEPAEQPDTPADAATAILEYNHVLRACAAVAERSGSATNWVALRRKVTLVLERNHSTWLRYYADAPSLTKTPEQAFKVGDPVTTTWPSSRKDVGTIKELPHPGGQLYVIAWPDGGRLCVAAEDLRRASLNGAAE